MKFYFSCILVLSFFLFSCNDGDEKRIAENLKEANKQESIFESINKSWNFSNPTLSPGAQTIANNWQQWKLLLTELSQKPKTSIFAFQIKAKALSKRVLELNNNIPPQFNKPEIKARIGVLTSKINAINLFINLHDIPAQKIAELIGEVNIELAALAQQMDEIVRKSSIPKEEGESDMLQMLDKSRAIPTIQNDPSKPQIE